MFLIFSPVVVYPLVIVSAFFPFLQTALCDSRLLQAQCKGYFVLFYHPKVWGARRSRQFLREESSCSILKCFIYFYCLYFLHVHLFCFLDSFFLVDESYSIAYITTMYINNIFFIHSSIDGPLGCFRVLAVVNDPAMNMGCRHLFEILFSSFAYGINSQRWNHWVIRQFHF